MAYMNQEKKKEIVAHLKNAIPKSWKWTVSVQNHSTICLTISAAPIDLIDMYTSKKCGAEVRESALRRRYCEINPYHFKEHFEGLMLITMEKIFAALNLKNHDKSDPLTDYYDVGHYVQVSLGRYDKPFVINQPPLSDLVLPKNNVIRAKP